MYRGSCVHVCMSLHVPMCVQSCACPVCASLRVPVPVTICTHTEPRSCCPCPGRVSSGTGTGTRAIGSVGAAGHKPQLSLHPLCPLVPLAALDTQSRQHMLDRLFLQEPGHPACAATLPENAPKGPVSYSHPICSQILPQRRPRPCAPLTLQDAGRHGVQPLAQGSPPHHLQQRQQKHGGDQPEPEKSVPCPPPSLLHPWAGKGGQAGGTPEMPEAGKEGWIYTVPPGRWEERGAGGTQTGEFINVAPRCQLGAGGAGGRAAGASMPPLFDEASGRAASDGRCAPALPAALDHFHAKPRPRHPPSCGPRAGGNAPAAADAGGPGWAWEPRRHFQRGQRDASGQGGGREGGGVRGGGSPLSVPAQPWLNGSRRKGTAPPC